MLYSKLLNQEELLKNKQQKSTIKRSRFRCFSNIKIYIKDSKDFKAKTYFFKSINELIKTTTTQSNKPKIKY